MRLELPLAGLGRRGLAFLTDVSIRWGIPAVVMALLTLSAPQLFALDRWGGLTVATLVFGIFTIQFLYHLLFEALWRGQTPGKRLLGIRVVEEGGRPVRLVSAAVRNLLRIADALPLFYGIGVFLLFVSRRHRRLGDLAAGTYVIHERGVGRWRSKPAAARSRNEEPSWLRETGLRLSPEEEELVDDWIVRRDELEPEPQRILAARVFRRILSRRGIDPEELPFPRPTRALEELAAAVGGPGSRSPGRFVQRRSADWDELTRIVERIEERGLRRTPPRDLEDLGRLYRAVATDLSRVRARFPGHVLAHELNDLLLRAHNLLYQGERTGLRELGWFYRYDIPRAFRRNARPVLLAAAIFLVSGFAAFLVASLRPDIAEALVGRELLDRYVRQERLWLDDFFNVLPGSVASAGIATNNITVTFVAFALGITLGLGTVYILVLNGINLGAVFAVCESYGLADDLGAFVVAHGILEITCVLVAGGAGLILGGALLAPGELRRRDALVVKGREAVALVLGTAPALVLAGLVEGFLSPAPDLPLWSKVVVGVALEALFLTWLLAGGRGETGGGRGAAGGA